MRRGAGGGAESLVVRLVVGPRRGGVVVAVVVGQQRLRLVVEDLAVRQVRLALDELGEPEKSNKKTKEVDRDRRSKKSPRWNDRLVSDGATRDQRHGSRVCSKIRVVLSFHSKANTVMVISPTAGPDQSG